MKLNLILTIVVVLALFTINNVYAQEGTIFPNLDGKTVSGKNITFPQDTKGKITLIGVAFSKKSDKLLKPWFNPTYETFMAEPDPNSFFPTTAYDVNVYFVGMLKGLAKKASGKIESSMNKKLDPKLHKHTVLSPVKLKDYKKVLNFGAKDQPYFYILDSTGKIIYATSGAYSERKMEEITDAIEKITE